MEKLKSEPDTVVGFINEVCKELEGTIDIIKDSLGVSKTRAIEIILKEKHNISSYKELEKEIESMEKKLEKEGIRNKAKRSNLRVVK